MRVAGLMAKPRFWGGAWSCGRVEGRRDFGQDTAKGPLWFIADDIQQIFEQRQSLDSAGCLVVIHSPGGVDVEHIDSRVRELRHQLARIAMYKGCVALVRAREPSSRVTAARSM